MEGGGGRRKKRGRIRKEGVNVEIKKITRELATLLVDFDKFYKKSIPVIESCFFHLSQELMKNFKK